MSSLFKQEPSAQEDNLLDQSEPSMTTIQPQLAPSLRQPKAVSIEELDRHHKETVPFNTKPVDSCKYLF